MKNLTYLIIFCLLIVSCSPSKHAGKTYVQKPTKEETNEAIWLSYWQDQFDGYKGNVVSPVSPEYNQNAINAWQRAKMEWDEKVAHASTNSTLLYIGFGLGAAVLVSVLVSSAASSTGR